MSLPKIDPRRDRVLPEAEVARELRRRTRRDFLIAGVAGAAGIGAYEWVRKAGAVDDVPWPQRGVLDFNGKLARAYVSAAHRMPEFSRERVTYLKPNGDYGLDQPAAAETEYRVQVAHENQTLASLPLGDIQALSKVDLVTRFCCIEGWSAIAWWGGARFADFTHKYFPPGRALTKYVYLATPGEDYYVGLDMKSAMHPQTVLAYERNGQALEAQHGAPLRLAIPVKYGIKNIKRIGLIRYTDTRPGDYWAEEGYDWFAGL